jgi:hypothetical protein
MLPRDVAVDLIMVLQPRLDRAAGAGIIIN